jgi:hypothetical protein
VGVAGQPRGVVTIVLTDLVSSTELWEREPVAMAHALASHDELVATVVAEGDMVLKTRGEGDSTFSLLRGCELVETGDLELRGLDRSELALLLIAGDRVPIERLPAA